MWLGGHTMCSSYTKFKYCKSFAVCIADSLTKEGEMLSLKQLDKFGKSFTIKVDYGSADFVLGVGQLILYDFKHSPNSISQP